MARFGSSRRRSAWSHCSWLLYATLRSPLPGRFEPVDEGQRFALLVDYAHTPDSLQNVLAATAGERWPPGHFKPSQWGQAKPSLSGR